jgi:hypothetical protein
MRNVWVMRGTRNARIQEKKMNALQAVVPIAAAAAPVLVLAAMNAWLWLAGERGTLLLPALGGWPAVALDEAPAVRPAAPEAPAEAYEEPLRLAA